MRSRLTLPALLHDFFHGWLVAQRNCSRHTVLSYRDSWVQLLRYVSERRHRPVHALSLEDIDAEVILGFLHDIETRRRVSLATRNCRLAALHSVFGFLADREPLVAAQCDQVLRIPFKRAPKRAPTYLEPAEVEAILRQPDRATPEGQRDHALLTLLYNTGARIDEVLRACPKHVRLEPPREIRLLGKGRKERVCPLWEETTALLAALLRRVPRPTDEPLFVNRYGAPLGASGLRYRLQAYVAAATATQPSLGRKRVTPHTFRHTTAVHLLAAGVDVGIIRSWLGHASLDTTNLYAEASVETKRRALELVGGAARRSRPPRWRRQSSVLEMLESL